MIPAPFDYVRPESLDEAVYAIASAGEEGKVLAGGQSLLPILRLRLSYPETLIDLGRIAELSEIIDDGDALSIGAMVTHAEVMRSPLVHEFAPLLAKATASVADRQVRNRGTFGGSLAHADPAGDLPAVALALGATLHARGPGGVRSIAAGDFFLDYLTTALAPDEILTHISVPKFGPEWGAHYEKFNRVAQAWSIVGVAAMVRRDDGAVAEARVGLTNMAATPVRATGVERALAGTEASVEAIAAAAAHAGEGTNPPSDLSGQADYRRHLAQVLTGRALVAAAGI